MGGGGGGKGGNLPRVTQNYAKSIQIYPPFIRLRVICAKASITFDPPVHVLFSNMVTRARSSIKDRGYSTQHGESLASTAIAAVNAEKTSVIQSGTMIGKFPRSWNSISDSAFRLSLIIGQPLAQQEFNFTEFNPFFFFFFFIGLFNIVHVKGSSRAVERCTVDARRKRV